EGRQPPSQPAKAVPRPLWRCRNFRNPSWIISLNPDRVSDLACTLHFDELDPEAGVVVLQNGDLAAADHPAVDHDLDRLADAAVERDGCALAEVHQTGDLHLRRAQDDLKIDR